VANLRVGPLDPAGFSLVWRIAGRESDVGRAHHRLAVRQGSLQKFAGTSDIPLFCSVMEGLASKVGRRGTIVLPAKLRRRLGIEEGSFVVAEAREDGILIRPATVLPVEVYTSERRAEFLLNNAVGTQDYRRARAEVKRMGLDPDRIKHHRPSKRG
jgi:AbrB family looped-hinge helix DNA binding protein